MDIEHTNKLHIKLTRNERTFPMTGTLMRFSTMAGILAAALVCTMLLCTTPADAVEIGDQAVISSDSNLAIVATPTVSAISGGRSPYSMNNNVEPKNSMDRSSGTYGNWPAKGTQWAQYEWKQPINTDKIDVYWWDDHRGIRLPKAVRLLYWDGNAFVPVKNASGLGGEADKYNTTTFDPVETTKLKLEFDGNGNSSTGIIEWKVYDSGKSAAVAPVTMAGIDRTVVLGGKTYLTGVLRTAGKNSDKTKAAWSKASGPGEVTFAEADNPSTTATFSKPGDYVLKLSGEKDGLSGSSTVNVTAIADPPEKHLDLVDTKTYKLDSPLWNKTSKNLIVNWIPHCVEKISDPDLGNGGINNFIEAAKKMAGKPHKGHRGPSFSNAWVYNTIESISIALMFDPQGDKEIIEAQKSLKAALEDWIPKVLAGQEADGYLQTLYTLSDRKHWSPRHRGDHEGYVAGYFLEAAIAHYLMTEGKDLRLYNAAKKLADCWDNNLGPEPKQHWYDGHQAMEIALVRFGRFVNTIEGEGKGDKYIQLSKFLLDCRGNGYSYDQSHVPVVRQYEAVGHAVRASYSYAGMSDVAMETGDPDYHSAVMSLWDNITNRKYYLTGGIGSGETSEGYGPNYSLRHNAYCEACSSCGQIFFQHKLNMTYHDAKYADLYEETLFNALLGSIDLEGKNFYYQNPLVETRRRYDWHSCPCCVGNIPRTLLMLPTWMYTTGDEGLYVNLFVGSTVTVENVVGMDVEMVQKTDYPFGGDVSITVNPAQQKEFTVRIRVPNRDVSELYEGTPDCDGFTSIKLNGKTIEPTIEKGYAAIKRTWKAGDKIDLVLPMKIQRITADERIESTRGQMALRYGPLLYSIESLDQDIDGEFDAKSPLTVEWREDFLGGVPVIKGKWSDGSPLLAIPNYARANRGKKTDSPDKKGGPGKSTVWFKKK